MARYICTTCGTQHADSEHAPSNCATYDDERQYVGWDGQRWTTHDELAKERKPRIEEEAGLVTVGVTPAFAIDQRSFLLPTNAGNILWECQGVVLNETVAKIQELGGLDQVVKNLAWRKPKVTRGNL